MVFGVALGPSRLSPSTSDLLMLDPQIEKLLIVQDRDIALQRIQQDLKRIPQERAEMEAEIRTETENIESASQDLKGKEVRRQELDSEVKAKEASLQKFRTQQLEVKKNDEYRALTLQIEQGETTIGELEELEIELMLEIDDARASYEAEKVRIENRIQTQRSLIDELAERERVLAQSAIDAQAELEAAKSMADPDSLTHYVRVRKLCKRPPYIAPIEEQKCGGCHLRVSNEIAKASATHGEIHLCDQCGRIVYR